MRHDSEGRLVDLLDWQIKPLLTPARTPSDGLLTDAEALAKAPEGSFFFEKSCGCRSQQWLSRRTVYESLIAWERYPHLDPLRGDYLELYDTTSVYVS